MLAALIQHNPKQILKIFLAKPYNVNISGKWQAQDVNIGFETPDREYQLVSVIPFTVPENKKIIDGSIPSYSFNQSEQVIETFEVEDLPLPPKPLPIPKIIIASDFISRFTDEEYSNIKKAALAQMQAGVATLQKWIDVATTNGFIDLDRPATTEAKNALVAANLLTQKRADIIFSIQE